jgi:hypothetical protein
MRRINKTWRDILSFLHDRSWVSIEDIQALFYLNLKYARRVMNEIVKLEYVKFVQCNLEENKKGPGRKFYALTKKGFRQYFSSTDMFSEAKILTGTGYYHAHIVNTILTGLLVLSRKYPGLNIESVGEKEMRRICSKLQNKNLVGLSICVPDFIFRITDGNNSRLYLAEVDANTETISNDNKYSISIKNKFDGIKNTVSLGLIETLSEKFSAKLEGFIYLHIAASGLNRISNIAECVRKLDVPYPVLLVPFSSIESPESILRPVWIHANSPNDTKISILEEI